MKFFILALIFFTLSMPATADQEDVLFNVVSLQAEAHSDIKNNEMTVRLRAEYEGSDSAMVADNINKKMQWALKQAKQFPEIKLETHSYSTYPVYNENAITAWRASQSILLVGQDAKKMTHLVAILQAKLAVKNMSFAPTRATRLQAEHALIEQAMQAFNAKVEIIKRSMDKDNVRIVKLDISSNKRYPQPRPGRMEMMAARSTDSVASPAARPGLSKVMVTVTGSVQFF